MPRPELKTSLRDRLVGNLGDAAESILRFIDSGAGADALALAIACQVVFGDGKDTTLEAAAARMEQYHGNKPIPPSIGRCLGAVATDAIADLDRREDSQAALTPSSASRRTDPAVSLRGSCLPQQADAPGLRAAARSVRGTSESRHRHAE